MGDRTHANEYLDPCWTEEIIRNKKIFGKGQKDPTQTPSPAKAARAFAKKEGKKLRVTDRVAAHPSICVSISFQPEPTMVASAFRWHMQPPLTANSASKNLSSYACATSPGTFRLRVLASTPLAALMAANTSKKEK